MNYSQKLTNSERYKEILRQTSYYSMEILSDRMYQTNVIPIIGNHEYMGLQCIRFLVGEITEESIEKLDEGMIQSYWWRLTIFDRGSIIFCR